MALCLVSWVQTMIYGTGLAVWKACAIGLATAAAFAGAQVAMIVTVTVRFHPPDAAGSGHAAKAFSGTNPRLRLHVVAAIPGWRRKGHHGHWCGCFSAPGRRALAPVRRALEAPR